MTETKKKTKSVFNEAEIEEKRLTETVTLGGKEMRRRRETPQVRAILRELEDRRTDASVEASKIGEEPAENAVIIKKLRHDNEQQIVDEVAAVLEFVDDGAEPVTAAYLQEHADFRAVQEAWGALFSNDTAPETPTDPAGEPDPT